MIHEVVDRAKVVPVDQRLRIKIEPAPAIGKIERYATGDPGLQRLLRVIAWKDRILEAQIEAIRCENFVLRASYRLARDRAEPIDAADVR